MKRGRPPHPDVLTPREWQVLHLLRDGLTNDAIARRLGISESGARYHVSQILAKLGVRRREEAAARRPDAPRRLRGWSPRVVVAGLPERVVTLLTPKFVAALIGTVATVGIGLAGVATIRSEPGSVTPATEAVASATPLPCAPHCVTDTIQRFTTLEEAAAVASFQPQLPAAVPAGFHPVQVEHGRASMDPPSRREVHNDWITVTYRDASGGTLVISQGFPARPAFGVMPGAGIWQQVPAEARGVVPVGDWTARWLQGQPWPTAGGQFDILRHLPGLEHGGYVLAWEVGRIGPGWAISPDGQEVVIGSPFSYGLLSDVLSLDELVGQLVCLLP
ncbi:MAG: LuxR C-terminal-related transcriptional regulator [Dehalococcoidia bacterium]